MNVTIDEYNAMCSFEMRHLESGELCKPEFDDILSILMQI